MKVPLNPRHRLRLLIADFFKWMPTILTRLLYFFILKLAVFRLKHLLKGVQHQVWTRNSYLQNRLTFFMSDVDLTILIEQKSLNDEAVSKIKALKRFRFPLQGELNIYLKDELHNLFQVMNDFELDRDPNLLKLKWEEGRLKNELTNPYEKCVFFFKAMSNDQMNLTWSSHLRKAKWLGHLRDLQLSHYESRLEEIMNSKEDPTEFLIQIASEILNLSPKEELKFKSAAGHWIRINALARSPNDLGLNFEENPWLYVFGVNKVGYSNNALGDPSIEAQGVLTEMIRWEIFAWHSQKLLGDSFQQHVKNLKHACRRMNRMDLVLKLEEVFERNV